MTGEAMPHATALGGQGLADALVILGAAGIVIPAFARLRISPVIGFILIGILVGPSGLGAVADRWPWADAVSIDDRARIEPFAEFGIILLLFAIGLDLSFRRLWSMRRLVFGLGAAETLGLGGLIALALVIAGWATPLPALGLGLALALSSTAIVMPIVGSRSVVGRTAFAMLLFEDLAIVPIIFLLAVLAARTGTDPVAMLATTLWQGAVVALLLILALRWALPPLFAQAARAGRPEMFLSIVLLTVLAAALATAGVGLSPVAGALLAGLMIAETDYREEVERIIEPLRGLALGVFLITVGMQVDLAAILGEPGPFLAAVATVLVIKAVGTALLLRLIRIKTATAAEIGLLMAAPGEATLIVLATATQVGLVSQADGAFWQAVTSVGMLITPLLAVTGQRAGRRLRAREAGPEPMADETTAAPTLIMGFGRVGQQVADLLTRHERPYIAIDADIDRTLEARRNGYRVSWGNVDRARELGRLPLDRAAAVVLTMSDPVTQLHLARRIRAGHPHLSIIARARDADHAVALYKAGVSDAVPETFESSLQLSEAVLIDTGVAMGPVIASVHDVRARQRSAILARAGLTDGVKGDGGPARPAPVARRRSGARHGPGRTAD